MSPVILTHSFDRWSLSGKPRADPAVQHKEETEEDELGGYCTEQP